MTTSRDEPHPGVAFVPANPVAASLRKDGDLLLTGRAEFLDDVAPAGLTHMALVRSPHPHAEIVGIDVTAAACMPGVLRIATAEDIERLAGVLPHFFDPTVVGCKTADFRCLATDKVRWVGDAVAAVVADTLAHAEAAADVVSVDYALLPHVLTAPDALAVDAPLLFAEWGDNVLGTFTFGEGDPDGHIVAAPHVLHEEFSVGRHQCAPMEARGYVAEWDKTGRLTFWASTQNPHPVRSNLATVLDVPEERIRVIAPRLGGGFGHKFNGYAEEYLVCVMSQLVHAPVKWLETRADSLLVGAREFTHIVTAGFDDDGTVLAIKDQIVGNIGSLATWGGWPMTFPAAMTYPGPYRIKHYLAETQAVVTNKAPWNGYRGYGKEQAALTLERTMDLIAQRLGIDPLEVRRRNFIPPEEFPYWTAAKHLDSGNYVGALDAVARMADYDGLRSRQRQARDRGEYLGIGVAFELTPEGGDFAGSFVRAFDTSTVRVHPTGSVTVLTGVTSPGTGNESTIADLVAAELGISSARVDVVQGDTDKCPYGFGNFSSRSLATGGAAAALAAREIRSRMTTNARALLGCPATDDVDFHDDAVQCRIHPDRCLPFAELSLAIYRHGLSRPGMEDAVLDVTKTDYPRNLHHAPDEFGRFSTYPSYPYSAHIALVGLDHETGRVVVLEYFVVDDCGVIISPTFVDGQIYGAVAQGIGGALWEEVPYDAQGSPTARTFKHYLIPRANDLPTIHVEHQQTPSPYTLLGTKGAGESGVGGAMAAIANAVNDALIPFDVRVHQLPLSPPTILAAISERGDP